MPAALPSLQTWRQFFCTALIFMSVFVKKPSVRGEFGKLRRFVGELGRRQAGFSPDNKVSL